MKIQIRYKRLDSSLWENHSPLAAEDYFDPINEERPFEWDDVPRFMHAAEYLDIPLAEISETELQILDTDNQIPSTITEIIWNSGKNRIIQVSVDDYKLLVAQIFVDTPLGAWHTIRVNRHTDGRLLLESLQALDIGEQQTHGPSTAISFPATQPVRAHLIEGGKATVEYRTLDAPEWKQHIVDLDNSHSGGHNLCPCTQAPGARLSTFPTLQTCTENTWAPAETRVTFEDANGQIHHLDEVSWNEARDRVTECIHDDMSTLMIRLLTNATPKTEHLITLKRSEQEDTQITHIVATWKDSQKYEHVLTRRQLGP